MKVEIIKMNKSIKIVSNIFSKIKRKIIFYGFKFFTIQYMNNYVDQYISFKTKDRWGNVYIRLDRSLPDQEIKYCIDI